MCVVLLHRFILYSKYLNTHVPISEKSTKMKIWKLEIGH